MSVREKILITGGARSGKSDHALKLASAQRKRVFIATAEALDEHMKKRISLHQRRRGKRFRTIEEPIKIAETLEKEAGEAEVVVIDCLTMWLSNLLLQGMSDEFILERVEGLARLVRNFSGRIIIVTNEVGAGIVPENELARRFRDMTGSANQIMAEACDKVILMSCGIPQVIKGGSGSGEA
jgi:adenosyl cobinamide kinase/adenosyl cobinamide phosphate guanylyltransferase